MRLLDNKECCPKFEPSGWDNKIFVWDKKKFIKDKVFSIFYIPMNFGSIMKKLDALVSKNNAKFEDYICLSEHTSKWNMNIYLAVDREIPKANNVQLSGKYLSKVYEGDFKNTKSWCDDFENYAKTNSYKLGKCYMWYTTCPKCAKKYGKNYVVLVYEIL